MPASRPKPRRAEPARDLRRAARHLDTRLRDLYEAIRSGKRPNARALAGRLEVSTRTIGRDIGILREFYGIKIRCDCTPNGYYLEDPAQPFPGAAFTESELLAVVVARQALAAHRGSPLEQILSDGFKRLEARLDNQQSYTLDTLSSLISFHEFGHEELPTDLFHQVTQALRNRRVLSFSYQGLNDDAPRDRRVHPYHLANINQKWYLFAFDPGANPEENKGIRRFALSRITRLRVTTTTFEPPTHFDPADHLKGSFGIHSGDPATEFRVVIRFDAWATRLITERRWHPTQEITRHKSPDGCTLTLRLSSMAEVRRWILSWGEHATVLEPAELRREVRLAAESILRSTAP